MKRLAGVFILFFTVFSLFSATTWTWSSPYRNTHGFRYQLNTDTEDNWTYVSSDVTSLTLENVPDNTTLYVQLSLDGINWSPSGVATYVPERNDDVSTPPARPTITSAEDMRRNRNFEFSMDIDLGFDTFYSDHLNVAPYLGGVLDFKNIYSPTYWFGLGLRVRGGASFTPTNGNIITVFTQGNGFADLDKGIYLDTSLALSFIVADSVDLTVAAGGGLTMLNDSLPSLFSIGSYGFGTYVQAGASLDRYFGQMFHIGISYYFKHFFSSGGVDSLNVHDIGLHLGLTF